MLTDEQIRNILGMHGALPLKDGATDSIIEGREAILIVAIRAILAAHSAGAQEPEWCERCGYPCRCAHPQPMPQTDAARDVLETAAVWLHAAYDRPPQSPECKAMLRRIDAEIERIDRAKGE